MRTPSRGISAVWIVGAATATLCVAFWLPFGAERGKTTYMPLANVVATFASAQAALNTRLGDAPSQAASQAGAASAPVAAALAGSGEAPGAAAHAKGRKPRRTPRRPGKETKDSAPDSRPAPPESPDARKDAPSPIEGTPAPAPAPAVARDAAPEFTPDAIRDAFEGELSKFPLDAKSASDRVTLRLLGLCRWQGHYILKVAVDNQTGSDFFVRELSAYDGSAYVTLKSYFRLLVEPGRTREGHLLFDARPGAQVKVALKEDRENGRALETPVRYPF